MAGGSEHDTMSRSTEDSAEDDLDRRIAEAEFLLAREQALQAARYTYRTVLSHLAHPAGFHSSDSHSELVPAGPVCNADRFSSAPEDKGTRATPCPPTLHPAATSVPVPCSGPLKQQRQANRRRFDWGSCWYPLLVCLSILTIPAEWAALKQSDVGAPRSVHRLWFLIASQVVLSFLGASQPARLAPSHMTVHVALQVSVLGSWVLSALSYVRSMTHNVEQELALALSFMRVLLSLNVGKQVPLLTLLVLGATATHSMSLVPQATLWLEPSHVLLACAAAAFCRWMLHHISTYGQALAGNAVCASKWQQQQQQGPSECAWKPC